MTPLDLVKLTALMGVTSGRPEVVIRPIFAEPTSTNGNMPSATPEELAAMRKYTRLREHDILSSTRRRDHSVY